MTDPRIEQIRARHDAVDRAWPGIKDQQRFEEMAGSDIRYLLAKVDRLQAPIATSEEMARELHLLIRRRR